MGDVRRKEGTKAGYGGIRQCEREKAGEEGK